jgi:hypothetical protein
MEMENSETLQCTERVGNRPVTRRELAHIGGVALIATTALVSGGCASTMGALGAPVFPQVDTGPITPQNLGGVQVGSLNGGTKPIYVALPGSMDPVAHSVADTLFWGEQLMEHAMFIAMLMPGPELSDSKSSLPTTWPSFVAAVWMPRITELSTPPRYGLQMASLNTNSEWKWRRRAATCIR